MFSAMKNAMNPDLPRSIFKEYCDLYKKIGAGINTIKYLDENQALYKELTMKEDVFYLFRTFFNDYNLSDTRLKQISESKFIDSPKNTQEIIAINIRKIFDSIENGTSFKVDTREIQDLALLITKHSAYPNTLKKHEKNEISYRERLEKLTNEYNKLIKENDVERIYLNIAFYIDLMKLSPFKYYNDVVAIIVLYCLMIESEIESIRYYSFFKALSQKKKELKDSCLQAFYHYEEGISDFTKTSRIFLNILKDSYASLEDLYNNLAFDKQLKKIKNVEVVIYSLNETFTKEDIRKKLPGVSDSTIDRSLKKLSDEGKIVPFGRGRSAKWLRIDHSFDEKTDFSINF